MTRYKLSLIVLLLGVCLSACSGTTLDLVVETATPVGTSTPSTLPPAPTHTPPPLADEPTATPVPGADPTLPALSPDIWEMHTYRNAAHGISFDYPAMLDDRADLNCGPQTQENSEGVTITVGLRSMVSLRPANGLTVQAYVDQTLAAYAITPTATFPEVIGGEPGITVEYRFGGTNRFGTLSVVQFGDRMAVFEMTAGGFCEIPQLGASEPQFYAYMKTTFQLGPPSTAQVNPILRSFVNSDTPSLLLLGGTQDGRWLDAAATAALLSNETPFQLYIPTGPLGAATSVTPASSSMACPGIYGLQVEPLPSSDNVIGTAGSWNAMPRIPDVLSIETDAYRQAVADLLVANGVSAPSVTLTQVLRIDLEGDGNDEVLISASHFAESTGHLAGPGDYSLVALRTVINNDVVTVPLAADYYPEGIRADFPHTYALGGVLDLNGDGRMEVVVDIVYWEGNAASVYDVSHDRVSQVLSVTCQP